MQKSLKDSAKEFQPKKTGNITELEVVNIETLMLEDRKGINDEGKEFSYQVVVVDGIDYRVPVTVINSIKTILTAKPTLKMVKVIKEGQGLNTKYTTIPIE